MTSDGPGMVTMTVGSSDGTRSTSTRARWTPAATAARSTADADQHSSTRAMATAGDASAVTWAPSWSARESTSGHRADRPDVARDADEGPPLELHRHRAVVRRPRSEVGGQAVGGVADLGPLGV